MTPEQEARAYLGLGPDDAPLQIRAAIVDAIVYPTTMPDDVRIACDAANVSQHDRDEIQRFVSFLRGAGPLTVERGSDQDATRI